MIKQEVNCLQQPDQQVSQSAKHCCSYLGYRLYQTATFVLLMLILAYVALHSFLHQSSVQLRRFNYQMDLQNVATLTQQHLTYYQLHSKWPDPGEFMNDDSTLKLMQSIMLDSRRQDVYRTQTDGFQIQFDLLKNGQFEVYVRQEN